MLQTHNHSAPYSFSILSPIGFSARTRPSSYLLNVKPSTEYACAFLSAGTRPRCLTIRLAFGGTESHQKAVTVNTAAKANDFC